MSSKNSEYRPEVVGGLGKMGRQGPDASDTQWAPSVGGEPAAAVNAKVRRTRGSGRIVLIVLCGAVVLFCLGGISAMGDLTFMPRWIPWTIAVGTALGTGMWGRHLWQRITGCRLQWVNYAVHVVMVSLLICCGLYLGNQLGASDRGDTVEAEVLKVYRETRYHTKRVSRKVYTRGDAYYVYYARVRFDNGLERNMPVSRAQYSKLRPGSVFAVEVHRGGLGYGVIRPKLAGRGDSFVNESRRRK